MWCSHGRAERPGALGMGRGVVGAGRLPSLVAVSAADQTDLALAGLRRDPRPRRVGGRSVVALASPAMVRTVKSRALIRVSRILGTHPVRSVVSNKQHHLTIHPRPLIHMDEGSDVGVGTPALFGSHKYDRA